MDKYLYDVPGNKLVCLEYHDGSLYYIDTQDQILYKVSASDGSPIDSMALDMQNPLGVTWAIDNFWILDGVEEKQVKRVSFDEKRIEEGFVAPQIEVKQMRRSLGLAYDGRYIWTLSMHGWGSKYFLVEPVSGEVIASLLSKSSKIRDFTWGGGCLWSIRYNGKAMPSRLHKQGLYEDDRELRTQNAHSLKNVIEPSGIAYHDNRLFILDKETSSIYDWEVD